MTCDYLDIKNNVLSQIKKAFKGKNIFVSSHPGKFDEAEIRRLMQRTPAILTSLMSIKDEDITDESYLEFVSWILYRASNKDRLYDGALSIVSALIGVIKNLDSPISFGGGNGIQAECLYTGSLDKINASLWAVRWKLKGRAVNSDGVIVLPDDLEWFNGYDSDLIVNNKVADDIVNF
ncbi:MAG: hypothetical protein P1P64_02725 [Treponemataceae bacterium]